MASSGGGGGGGGGADSRSSKEAVGMMALHDALRNVCLTSDWTYSVFWTIRPRPRCRGGNGCKVGDENGSLMLMWEDGFCRPTNHEMDVGGEDGVRKTFSKMSIQLYNYGEGLMGKVASDKCHKWVFKEPPECEQPNISNYWQSSFDALPPEWTDQFACGIQTIAVIQAGHGLLQLGSCKIIAEDLHFVLRMRHMFESLGYQSGFFISQLFSSTIPTASPSMMSLHKQSPARPPPLVFNWNHHPPSSAASPHNFHPYIGLQHPPNNKDHVDTHGLYGHMEEMLPDHQDSDIKWPNGLSFFTALTGGGRSTDYSKPLIDQHPLGLRSSSHMNLCGPNSDNNGVGERGSSQVSSDDHHDQDYLSLEGCHSSKALSKFKRSFTMPARMQTPSSSSTQPVLEYRPGSEAGIYSDIMDTLE